jgi:hypothetical protein
MESFESVTLEHPYSVIYVPPRSKFVNHHLSDMAQDVEWHGNILVVKHTRNEIPISIQDDEHALVSEIVKM